MTTTLQQDSQTSNFALLAYNKDGLPANGGSLPTGWIRIDKEETGSFAAFAYQNTNTGQVVIAYRGTDDIGDGLGADRAFLTGGWDSQFELAARFAARVKNIPDIVGANILVTGHSLGGGLAQIVSQMFGFDGVTIDPAAAARVVSSPQFQSLSLELVQNANGLGMSTSFTNWVVADSVVSGGTGAQLGQVQTLPGIDFSLWDFGKSLLLGAVNPALGLGYAIGADLFGNKHASAQVVQALRMLESAQAEDALNNGGILVSGVSFVPKQEIVIDANGQPQIRNVQGEILIEDTTGTILGILKYSGDLENRKVDLLTPDGRIQSRVLDYQGVSHVVPVSSLEGVDGDPITNLSTLTTTTDAQAAEQQAQDPTRSVSEDNATLLNDGAAWIQGVGDVNTAQGTQQAANLISADGCRPGNQNTASDAYDADKLAAPADPAMAGAQTNLECTGLADAVPVDPLVLDLNSDGVRLTDFASDPVLFDADHDGGSQEITGWVSREDGIVVYDLNNNGKIDDISETISEYFNGAAGANGTAGTKPYANGFAALKSLDSNGDNAFTSLDAAWNNVKVWIDADHDGKSFNDANGNGILDAGETTELKTLDELGITRINLTGTSQSGLVRDGNEILTTGTFVQNGQTKEALAANFIADPNGNTATADLRVTTESGVGTYVSGAAGGEAIDVGGAANDAVFGMNAAA